MILKPTTLWDKTDFDSCGWNSNAMKAIYNGVTVKEFQQISNYEIAKET